MTSLIHWRAARRRLRAVPRTLLVLPLAMLAVCGHSDVGNSSTSAIAGTTDSSPAQVARRSALAPQIDREIREMVRYQLSLDKVERFARAADNLAELTKETARPAHSTVPTSRDLDQYGGLMGYAAAEYEWDPRQRHAIERAGLHAWEYITIMFVLTNTHDQVARFASSPMDGSSALVSRENLAFYADHRTEIERLVPSLSGHSGASAGEVK